MAIKAGQILHVTGGFVIDRIQTGGPSNLNIPQERIFELGNYQSVALVRDIPDLTFSLDCLDVGTEVEALLTGSTNPGSDADGTMYDLSLNKNLDIISPWKNPYGAYATVNGVAVPQLTLESASYRYGVRDNAGETFQLRGDSIYYIPGQPVQDQFTGNGSTTAYTLSNTALTYNENGVTMYALNVSVDGVRMTKGTDYTDNATTVTFTTAPANASKISIVYGTATSGTFGQGVHEALSVKPAAIKGKDIDVYFSTAVTIAQTITNVALTSNVATITTSASHGLTTGDVVTLACSNTIFSGTFTLLSGSGTTFTFALTHANVSSVAATGSIAKAVEIRWQDVQSFSCEWRVNLEDDYEFGNPRSVVREFTDVPDVSGSVEIKPRTVAALLTRLQQITGVATNQVIGPQSSVAGSLRVVLRNPQSGGTSAVSVGTVLKTLYVPAARFTIPGYEGRVQQKVSMTLNFSSDDGLFYVYKGAKP